MIKNLKTKHGIYLGTQEDKPKRSENLDMFMFRYPVLKCIGNE